MKSVGDKFPISCHVLNRVKNILIPVNFPSRFYELSNFQKLMAESLCKGVCGFTKVMTRYEDSYI
jgi:hypothetical protein